MADRAQDKRLRRAAEQVQRCLARRDLNGAVSALLELPSPARAPLLAVVAPVFQRSLAAAGERSSWGELHTLAARAEAEPGLLQLGAQRPLGGERTIADDVRWRLLLACLRAKDWSRGSRYLAALRPLLDARAPVLGQILQAWIETRGELDGGRLAAAGWRPPPADPPDPRLGHDPPARARPLPPAPAAAKEAEAAVLALAATRPFGSFADGLLAWLTPAAAPVAAEIRRVAAGLAVRELLRATVARAPLAEALRLLASSCGRAEPSEALGQELALALRLILQAAERGGLDPRSHTWVAAVAVAAGRHPATRDLLVGWLLTRSSAKPGPLPLLLAEALLAPAEGLSADACREIWAVSLRLLVIARPPDALPPRAPSWLEAATEALLAAADQLGRWLAALEEGRRESLLDAVTACLSGEQATRVLEAVWDASEARAHQVLAARVLALIGRVQEDGVDALLSGSLRPSAATQRVLRALEQEEDGDDEELLPLLPQARNIMRRLGDRALCHDPELLSYALADASGEQEQRRLVARYLEGRQGEVEIRLQAIKAVVGTGRRQLQPLVEEILEALLDDFRDDPLALAKSLLWAERQGAPRAFRRDVARALVHSMLKVQAPSPPSPLLARALELAEQLCPPPKGRRAGRKKPGRTRKQPDAPPEAAPPPAPAAAPAPAPPPAPQGRRGRRPGPAVALRPGQLILPLPAGEEPA